ncbi:hypothetical protein DMH15_14620 [Streptomyces sp. WAC 06725]|nr:hypothetical protein DMH15_14620 [Streptomyces sp. WAC 06725]
MGGRLFLRASSAASVRAWAGVARGGALGMPVAVSHPVPCVSSAWTWAARAWIGVRPGRRPYGLPAAPGAVPPEQGNAASGRGCLAAEPPWPPAGCRRQRRVATRPAARLPPARLYRAPGHGGLPSRASRRDSGGASRRITGCRRDRLHRAATGWTRRRSARPRQADYFPGKSSARRSAHRSGPLRPAVPQWRTAPGGGGASGRRLAHICRAADRRSRWSPRGTVTGQPQTGRTHRPFPQQMYGLGVRVCGAKRVHGHTQPHRRLQQVRLGPAPPRLIPLRRRHRPPRLRHRPPAARRPPRPPAADSR